MHDVWVFHTKAELHPWTEFNPLDNGTTNGISNGPRDSSFAAHRRAGMGYSKTVWDQVDVEVERIAGMDARRFSRIIRRLRRCAAKEPRGTEEHSIPEVLVEKLLYMRAVRGLESLQGVRLFSDAGTR